MSEVWDGVWKMFTTASLVVISFQILLVHRAIRRGRRDGDS